MKVKDTAMGMYFSTLTPDEAAIYIAQSLYKTSGGVFWDIVEHYDLSAKDPFQLGHKVYERLMDFDPEVKNETH